MENGIKFEFSFKTPIKDYVDYFIDKIESMRERFILNNYNNPEVVYMDWYTYKKLEIANRQSDSFRFSMSIVQEYEKSTLFGMDIIVLPVYENKAEIMFLGYKDNNDNVELGMRRMGNGVDQSLTGC